MNAALFIFRHITRIRRTGLTWQCWATLLCLEVHNGSWLTCAEITKEMAWFPASDLNNARKWTEPLVALGLAERRQDGGSTSRSSYRITPAGRDLLKLPTAKA